MKPLVSVVIPTANRPQWLPRAVESALAGMDRADIEVIVVPNGPDQSWHESLMSYKGHPSVRIFPIVEANANIARNIGMENARGDFIRFLDDDDYLIPDGAIEQYTLLQASGADVITGSIKLIDSKGRNLNIWKQTDTSDFCAAVLSPKHCCLPTAYVYKRSKIKTLQWNSKTKIRQDVEWLMNFCAKDEVLWIKTGKVVGVWQHHWEGRISVVQNINDPSKHIYNMLVMVQEKLLSEGRMTDQRQQAIALGMWGCVHSAFYLEPKYWTNIAYQAMDLEPNLRPVQPIYHFPLIRKIHPLVMQWLLMPKKWFTHHSKGLLKKIKSDFYW